MHFSQSYNNAVTNAPRILMRVVLDCYWRVVGAIVRDVESNRLLWTKLPERFVIGGGYRRSPRDPVLLPTALPTLPYDSNHFFIVLRPDWFGSFSREDDMVEYRPGIYNESTAFFRELPDEFGRSHHILQSIHGSSFNSATYRPPAIDREQPPIAFLPIGTTVYVLNHQYQFGSPTELVAKITDSSEFNRSHRSSGPYPWYLVTFANGIEDRVDPNNVIPTNEYFSKYCELYPSTVYWSNINCGELFSAGERFILRDRYLFNRNNQVQLLYTKFQSLFTPNDQYDPLQTPTGGTPEPQ
jgi:hypothetical protein